MCFFLFSPWLWNTQLALSLWRPLPFLGSGTFSLSSSLFIFLCVSYGLWLTTTKNLTKRWLCKLRIYFLLMGQEVQVSSCQHWFDSPAMSRLQFFLHGYKIFAAALTSHHHSSNREKRHSLYQDGTTFPEISNRRHLYINYPFYKEDWKV